MSCGGDTPKHFHPALTWFRSLAIQVMEEIHKKMSTGLKELTGCMGEIQIHPL